MNVFIAFLESVPTFMEMGSVHPTSDLRQDEMGRKLPSHQSKQMNNNDSAYLTVYVSYTDLHMCILPFHLKSAFDVDRA